MNDAIPESLDAVCSRLAAMSPSLETVGAWPGDQLAMLAEAGVLRCGIPSDFGGNPLAPRAMTTLYLRLAEACLATTFVLTQRNAACQRLALAPNEDFKRSLLPALARGERFATVGISHLTTSRQHMSRPPVAVTETEGGYRLDGVVPWVTGAAFADDVVTGGVLPDGRQLLLAVPRRAEGVHVEPPASLLALDASQTASMQLDGVRVPAERAIVGPAENVMKSAAAGGTGSLTTSALAIGAAGASLSGLAREAEVRADLKAPLDALAAERDALRADLLDAADAAVAARASESIRQRANSLALRSSQAFLAASKGAGFVKGHPAERAVRESLFFLVWSCPQPVVAAALREFACPPPS